MEGAGAGVGTKNIRIRSRIRDTRLGTRVPVYVSSFRENGKKYIHYEFSYITQYN